MSISYSSVIDDIVIDEYLYHSISISIATWIIIYHVFPGKKKLFFFSENDDLQEKSQQCLEVTETCFMLALKPHEWRLHHGEMSIQRTKNDRSKKSVSSPRSVTFPTFWTYSMIQPPLVKMAT
jgi:hypothetical protein